MSNNKRRITMYVSSVVTVLILIGPLASEGRGDFVLWDDEEFTVQNNVSGVGTLYDRSHARVVSGGLTPNIYAYDQSTVTTSGGTISRVDAYHTSSVEMSSGRIYNLYANGASSVSISDGSVESAFKVYNSSTVNISGGSIVDLYAYDTTNVDISGASMRRLYAEDSSTVNISGMSMDDITAWGNNKVNLSDVLMDDIITWGGSKLNLSNVSMDDVYAHGTVSMFGCSVDSFIARTWSDVKIFGTSIASFSAENHSTTTFIVRDFRLGDGLTLDADRLLGTGRLSYESYDGTRLMTVIESNHSGATILLVTGAVTQITAPETDLQDGLPLETATVSPGGDGEVGGLHGIWLRGDGVGGDGDYRWSISGGPEALPLGTLLTAVPDTDLDGRVDDYFLTFAHLAEVGAHDRAFTSPYTLRLEALDSGGLPIAGSESEILLLVPEPATLILMNTGLPVLLKRKRKPRLRRE